MIELMPMVQAMTEDKRLAAVPWHHTLALTKCHIEFQAQWVEGNYQSAFKSINHDAIVTIFSGGHLPDALMSHRVLAIQWALPCVEKVILEAAKKVRADSKSFSNSLQTFYKFLCAAVPHLPQFPVLAASHQYAERDRAEKLCLQIDALKTLSAALLAESGIVGIEKRWPSEERLRIMHWAGPQRPRSPWLSHSMQA